MLKLGRRLTGGSMLVSVLGSALDFDDCNTSGPFYGLVVEGPASANVNADHPLNSADSPRDSSMRRTSFHLAMRSERVNEPTFSWPASQPTLRWAMVMSSVSPE